MTNVRVLPLHLTPDGALRLCAQLERDARAGVDLGSRRVQIAGLSESLAQALEVLGDDVRRVVAALPDGDPVSCRLCEAALATAQIVQTVMRWIDTDLMHGPPGSARRE
ncbi:hypothetical protein [Methylobacterium sp. SyP6R]|uniref:hypothetical protein n=1 Tax=Methylobacterium sp. SyP6R TaxID=2718876 RepID=UPI001F2BDA37|nr:hypothetical protein [Methylobacterium sp. SyP6R]MCF4129492.1 hypothetical protein [Methylobacterium sp. SyP6R]